MRAANELTDVIAPSCYSCFDYTNAVADLVIGYMGVPYQHLGGTDMTSHLQARCPERSAPRVPLQCSAVQYSDGVQRIPGALCAAPCLLALRYLPHLTLLPHPLLPLPLQSLTVRNERGAEMLDLVRHRLEVAPPVAAGSRRAFVMQTVLADDE